MLLRFNTFFTVTARLHAEADKKRALHELAACVRLSYLHRHSTAAV